MLRSKDINSDSFDTVCVVKPNQIMNVALRALKSIANLNQESLTPADDHFLQISKIELVDTYSPQ